jgi:RND family efflux transporter MFP subunit
MADESKKGIPDLSSLRIDPQARTSENDARRKWLWIGLAAAAVLVLLIIIFTLTGRKAKVQVAQAKPGSGTEAMTVLNASGYVTPRRRATVAAKITGRVKEVLVDEGMTVKEGQILARLDDSDTQAAYSAAKAERAVALSSIPEVEVNIADAKRTLERNRALLKDGFVDKETVDHNQAIYRGLQARLKNLKEQVTAAEARMLVAQRDIENCTVRAPFSGIAVSKDAQPGEMVSPISAGGGFTRTGISTIVDMSSLEIEVDVNESYIAKVTPGQRVEAVLDAYPDWRIPASVRTIIPTADRQKATVKVRISFDKLDPKILPDMGVKVSFLSSEPLKEQARAKSLVPKEAIRQEAGQSVVFILKEGRLERRAVSTGQGRESDIEILGGVAPGEQVVVAGPAKLKDGQKAVSR